jgi:hypothetical protein
MVDRDRREGRFETTNDPHQELRDERQRSCGRALSDGVGSAVCTGVKVVIHAAEPYESSCSNPLGPDRAPHRIWTWADGSWLLLRFFHDGETIAVTSPEISATMLDGGSALVVRVARRAPSVADRASSLA